MQEIRIVEYSHSLAEKVADMWNKSAEGWNGMNTSRTAEKIISEHSNAYHLNVFLAINSQDEVIGYCSLDKYTQDEGALYINTLNVRPDYHGKKVGKMLVLACVKRTMELDWPRLDLYTWPGNTKAVPLYKKCGFFWEKREDTTHLMNYMPSVLKTEAIQDFFSEADWYEDSKRVIEVKPDGRKENGFDYFEYNWEHSGKNLRVEFERTGRGMRLIETDDYLISAVIENHELVFGRDYSITYSIINKTGRPLKVELYGRNDKNITYSLQHSAEVTDTESITGRFHLGEVTEDQKPGRTHPGVVTEVFINGRKAVFKTGVLPVYPASITLHVPGHQCYLNKEALCILDLENKFRETAVFAFSLQDRHGIHFLEPTHSISLKPGERTTVDIPYILNQYLFYSEVLNVKAKLADGAVISFSKRLDKAFRGRNGILWGESEDFCEIFNGPFMLHLNKQDNWMWSRRIYSDKFNPVWVFPKIGHPFSSELADRKADHIECSRDDDAAVMKATYTLNDFPGLRLFVITRLEASGIIKRYYEVENLSETETSQEVWLSDSFSQPLFRGVLPYENRFVHVGADTEWTSSFWESSKITENWVFSCGKYTNRGICWEPDQLIKFDDWSMFFEFNLGKIPSDGKVATSPVTFAIGVFDRWQDFRAYALQRDVVEVPEAFGHTSIEVNGGNPFVGDDFEVTLKEYRNMGSNPVLSLSKGSGRNPDIVMAEVEIDSFIKDVQSAIFRKGKNDIHTGTESVSGKKVLWLDNGLLTMKASPDFYHALFSLQYSGNEWLDSSFPTPSTKSWWNPWFGGICLHFEGISPISMLEERCKAAFVSLADEWGNRWQGIKVSVAVEKNERYKGLTFDFYYLTLPGVPLLISFYRIHQNTGLHIPWKYIEWSLFFKADPDIFNNQLQLITMDGDRVRMKAGKSQNYALTDEPILYHSPNRKEKLMVYTDINNQWLEAGTNNSLLMAFAGIRRELKNRDVITVPPVFLIFTEEYMNADLLRDLKNIRFDFRGERNEDH
jgi:ribosomal protein S18 acetylase RimI-like enzyme